MCIVSSGWRLCINTIRCISIRQLAPRAPTSIMSYHWTYNSKRKQIETYLVPRNKHDRMMSWTRSTWVRDSVHSSMSYSTLTATSHVFTHDGVIMVGTTHTTALLYRCRPTEHMPYFSPCVVVVCALHMMKVIAPPICTRYLLESRALSSRTTTQITNNATKWCWKIGPWNIILKDDVGNKS